MQNYRSVLNDVVAQFEQPMIVAADQEEAGKAQLCRAAAWQITLTRNPNVGLLSKTSGNNVMGFSVDVLLDRADGSSVDCASSKPAGGGFVEIVPVWVDQPAPNPAWIALWVQPTPGLANAAGPLKVKGNVDPPVPIPPTPQQIPMPDLSQLPASWSPSNYEPRSMGYYTEAAAGIEQVYRVVFNGRAADWGGGGNWMWWVIEHPETATVPWMADQFMHSEEFYGLHPERRP